MDHTLAELLEKAKRGEFAYCENPHCPGYVLVHSRCSDKRAQAETKRREAAEMDEATRAAFDAAMAVYEAPTLGPVDGEVGLFLAGVEHGRKRPRVLKPSAFQMRKRVAETQAKLAKLLAAARRVLLSGAPETRHDVTITIEEFEALAAAVKEADGEQG